MMWEGGGGCEWKVRFGGGDADVLMFAMSLVCVVGGGCGLWGQEGGWDLFGGGFGGGGERGGGGDWGRGGGGAGGGGVWMCVYWVVVCCGGGFTKSERRRKAGKEGKEKNNKEKKEEGERREKRGKRDKGASRGPAAGGCIYSPDLVEVRTARPASPTFQNRALAPTWADHPVRPPVQVSRLPPRALRLSGSR